MYLCNVCLSIFSLSLSLSLSLPSSFSLSLTHTGPGGWNDADFIYTGGQGCSDYKPLEHCPGQTDVEYRTEFSMWCIIGSSLIVATDIRNMTDIMKEVNVQSGQDELRLNDYD